ncbi:YfaP family protein [Zunongwangia sp. H14]|uniref:YfaP family protein n=1 Tax=Zunongwangia sp. H14 TaxID=3240792 RepID=UPI0035682503
MKNFRFFLWGLMATGVLFVSCSTEERAGSAEEQEMATLSFGASLNDLINRQLNTKQAANLPECSDAAPATVVVVLSEGGEDMDPVTLNILSDDLDGDGNEDYYTDYSDDLELLPGTYQLEEFIVYDAGGNIIWLAPIDDDDSGEYDGYVGNPLPISINLGPGVKKYVDVEVLCYDHREVNQYGYVFFDIITGRAIDFCIFGNYCTENGRHYVAEYEVDVWYGTDNTGTVLYTGIGNTLEINEDGDEYSDPVCLTLPDTNGADSYYFEISMDGEVIRSGTITDEEVRTLFDGDNNVDYYHFQEGGCTGGDSPNLFDEGGNGGEPGECNPEDPNTVCEVQRNFEQNYFSIQSGAFHAENLPEPDSESLEILQISGNSNVLAGGSNLIEVRATGNTTEVIVGVQGAEGFFTVPVVLSARNRQAAEVTLDLSLLISQQAMDHFTIIFAPGDGQGNYGQYQTLQVTRQEAGTGLLQISLSWDQLNDVDLYLIQPDGQQIFYGNRNSTNGGELDVDSNPGCSIDGINNENIFYEDDPGVSIQNGQYEVMVDLWSNCNIPGNTNFTVVAYYDGQLIVPATGANPFQGQLTPADDNGITTPVMTFNIPNSALNRSGEKARKSYKTASGSEKIYKFEYDRNNKVFENFNPKVN